MEGIVMMYISRSCKRSVQLFLLCLCLLAANVSVARSFEVVAWQSIVESADFVGVVECKRAAYVGPKTGQYHFLLFDAEIHDAWKNTLPSTTITFAIGTSDPHFDYGDPKPEVGKRYFLFGVNRWTSHADPPPAGADYELLHCHVTDVEEFTPSRLPVNFGKGTWVEFKEAAQAYLSLPEADRELERLKASLAQSLTLQESQAELLFHAPNVKDLVAMIFTSSAYEQNELYRQAVWQVLTHDGGNDSLQAINASNNLEDLVRTETLERYRQEIAFRAEKKKSLGKVASQ